MNTIQDLFEQSQLSKSAYADFSIPGVSTKDALIAIGFSPAQATIFAQTYEIIDHEP